MIWKAGNCTFEAESASGSEQRLQRCCGAGHGGNSTRDGSLTDFRAYVAAHEARGRRCASRLWLEFAPGESTRPAGDLDLPPDRRVVRLDVPDRNVSAGVLQRRQPGGRLVARGVDPVRGREP